MKRLALIGVLFAACSQPVGLVAQRPYDLVKPAGYDGTKPAPLVILLHGYMDSATGITNYFDLDTLIDARGFLYATPEGTVDSTGKKFWNATEACCNYERSRVDDVAYLTAVVDDAVAKNNVDRKRIYFMGHSNGGFMALRMGCELSPRIAGIISVAGAGWENPTRCVTTSPVNVLQVHGDLDDNVFYDGGTRLDVPYPSAPKTVEGWAKRNGCTGALTGTGMHLDADKELAGEETIVARWTGCPDGGAAELWTVTGAGHKPDWPDGFAGTFYNWLMDHPKP